MVDPNYVAWAELFSEEPYNPYVVQLYLDKKFNFDSLSYLYNNADLVAKRASKRILSAFMNTSLDEIIETVRKTDMEPVTSSEFPWFYSIEEVMFIEMAVLMDGPLTNEELGMRSPLCRLKSKANTQRFGQAHSNMLSIMGLVEHVDSRNHLTPVGTEYDRLSVHQRIDVFTKMLFRIPLMRDVYRNDPKDIDFLYELTDGVMKHSSVQRRSICIRQLVDEIESHRHTG